MAKNIPTIEGNRINLKEIKEDFLDIVMDWRNRPEVMKCFFNRSPLTSEGQRKWFEKYSNDESDHMFMIQTKEDIPIGTIAIYNIDKTNNKAEYGRLLIAADGCQGKGYAIEAIELLLNYGFNTLRLNRIYFDVFADNLASIGVNERCGFKKEGVLREDFCDGGSFRDLHVMGILKSEYELRQKRFNI